MALGWDAVTPVQNSVQCRPVKGLAQEVEKGPAIIRVGKEFVLIEKDAVRAALSVGLEALNRGFEFLCLCVRGLCPKRAAQRRWDVANVKKRNAAPGNAC